MSARLANINRPDIRWPDMTRTTALATARRLLADALLRAAGRGERPNRVPNLDPAVLLAG